MDELQEIDVEQIMERIQENIRRRRTAVGEGLMPSQGVPPSQSPAPPSDGQVAADLASLHSSYDIYHIPFTSHRKILGPFVVFVKKILRKLLTPILTRQVAYNAVNARVATYLKEQIDRLGQQQAQLVQVLEDRLAQLRDEIQAAHAQELQRLQGKLETSLQQQAQALQASEGRLAQIREPVQAQELQTLRERISRAERRLNRILYFLTDDQEREGKAEVEQKKGPRQTLEPDFDSLGFGERFWGSEAEHKERRRIYVEYFKGQEDVLDIGCGRGEFLELLKEAGIPARGVDLDLDMVLLCREKGLDVLREDVFAYLESLPDESLGGIFAAQVIEHLEPNRVIELVKLCHQKLRPGGVLTLETPNPKCLMVFAESFYMDFTHTRPIHPEAMKFLFEAAGFQDVELKYLAPVDAAMRLPPLPDIGVPGDIRETFNRGIERLNELLYGFQDYAVIGRKGSVQT